MSDVGDLRAENERLHQEIRGLNGQLEGLMRAMAGLRDRLDRANRKIEELKALGRESGER